MPKPIDAKAPGEPFTRPQLELFLAGLLMEHGDGEATIKGETVRAAEGAVDGIRLLQLCHDDGAITIELAKPWPRPCGRWNPLLEDGFCWRCGWEPEWHTR